MPTAKAIVAFFVWDIAWAFGDHHSLEAGLSSEEAPASGTYFRFPMKVTLPLGLFADFRQFLLLPGQNSTSSEHSPSFFSRGFQKLDSGLQFQICPRTERQASRRL